VDADIPPYYREVKSMADKNDKDKEEKQKPTPKDEPTTQPTPPNTGPGNPIGPGVAKEGDK
jgi:hypothetical protein